MISALSRWLVAVLTVAAAAMARAAPVVRQVNVTDPVVSLLYLPRSQHVLARTAANSLWTSHDEGRTWTEQTALRGQTMQVIASPANDKLVFVLGSGYTHWRTTDGGLTFSVFTAPAWPSLSWASLTLHQRKPEYIVYHGMSCGNYTTGYPPNMCYVNTAYLSTDMGATWRMLFDTVDHCDFGINGRFRGASMDTMYCGRLVIDNDQEFSTYLLRSDYLFDRAYPIKFIFERYMYDFAIVDDFLVVTSPSTRGEVDLWTSKDGITFTLALFPQGDEFGQHDYMFVESNQGTMLMALSTSTGSSVWKHLVSSSSSGQYFLTRLEHMHTTGGLLDFENIASLEGVMLANQVTNWQTATYDSAELHSMISFNDGATWQPLQAPTDDTCTDLSCALHLHGNTERRQVGSIFSATSAIGLGAGVGNVGSALKDYTLGNTYLTNDGGQTWRMIRRGPHLHEFGDHGAVIVIVNDLDPTNHIRYSFDEGETWSNLVFTQPQYKMRVDELTTKPDSESLVFVLHGYLFNANGSNSGQYQMISVDFATELVTPCDINRDFEDWSMVVAGDTQNHCVLGHEITYRRRKATSKCFVGTQHDDARITVDHCQCSRNDYECDFNFLPELNSNQLTCTRIPGTSALPANCTYYQFYNSSSGYLRIPASTCIDGLRLDKPVKILCNTTSSGGGGGGGTNPPDDEVTSTETTFSFKAFMSFDYFEGSSRALMLDMQGSVWLTADEGATWMSVYKANGTGAQVSRVYMHPYSSSCAILLVPKGRSKITCDAGATFRILFSEPVFSQSYVTPFAFKRDEPATFIAMKENCNTGCHAQAFITEDMGNTFTLMVKYPRKCIFAKSAEIAPQNTANIFCEIDDTPVGAQGRNDPYSLYRSDDKFRTKYEIMSDVVGLLAVQKYIITATYDLQNDKLELIISLDANTFTLLDLDVDKQLGFTFLESSSIHSLFMDVLTHSFDLYGVSWGTLLVSNSDATDFNVALEYTNRQGFDIDFERVEGLDGVLVANIISNPEDVTEGLPKLVQTLISFDDGREWAHVNAPNVDSLGRQYEACYAGSCYLHLHTEAEGRLHGNVFSSSSAPGLMIAVGNVGSTLGAYEQANTFMTIDGGLSWREIRKKPHLFEFGDRGSIAVIIPDLEDTNVLHYSYDFGATWTSFTFTPRKLRVTSLTTDPHSVSRKFLIFGTTTAADDIVAGTFSRMIQVDFTGLHERPCTAIDFVTWTTPQCVLGHRTTYSRRNASSACYINDLTQTPIVVSTASCNCTSDDFECATGFEINRSSDTCIPKDPSTVAEPAQCRPGTPYMIPSGYRRIPGDTCTGGQQLDRNISKVCLGSGGGPTSGPTPTATSPAPIITNTPSMFGVNRMMLWYHVPSSDRALFVVESGEVYLTTDEGLSWSNVPLGNYISPVLKLAASPDGHVITLITASSTFYISSNFGTVFASEIAPVEPAFKQASAFIIPHPHSDNALLAVGTKPNCGSMCTTVAFFRAPETSFEWRAVSSSFTNVVTCVWLTKQSMSQTDYRIICEAQNPDDGTGRLALRSSATSFITVLTRVTDWFVGVGFIAAMVPREDNAAVVDLYVWGSDTQSFEKASVPSSITMAARYHRLVAAPVNSILIDVNPMPRVGETKVIYGTLLSSGSVGTSFVFTRALNYLYRTTAAQDVQSLPGIDGIFIANMVMNPSEATSGATPIIRSVITFDNGGRWTHIPAPATNELGKPTACDVADGCSLHLHSLTHSAAASSMTAQQRMGAAGAVGFAVSVGNTGDRLLDYGAGDTYLSTDAGRTWRMVRAGPHLHAYVDNGALIVLVNDKDATDRIRYSWDYGQSWRVHYFLPQGQKMRVSMLEAFADSTSQRVMLFGRTSSTSSLLGISVDFSDLHERICSPIDFEAWSPSDDTGVSCVLGHEITYQRRKPDSECTIDDHYVTPIPTIEPCTCRSADFECDWGYEHSSDYSMCVAMVPGLRDEPASCPKGTSYMVPSGFRKIPIDTCANGMDLTKPIMRICGLSYGDPTFAPSSAPTASRPPPTQGPPTAAATASPTAPTNAGSTDDSGGTPSSSSGGITAGEWLLIILIPIAIGLGAIGLWIYRKHRRGESISFNGLFRSIRYSRVSQQEPEDFLLEDY